MSTTAASGRVISTQVPARLDRLPWSRFHWRIVIGLGTVWILDGLEVTIVGAIAPRLTEAGSGIGLNPAQIGTAAAIYVAGACTGALLFGQLTDRYGRKRLFMATLLLYLMATVATAFATEAWYFYLCRFLTGAGIGGEYAAINSAIDELIPARNRGQVDLAINGSYWVGSAIGGLAALLLLDTSLFDRDVGWRLAFAAGAILGLGILLVRRHVPESPRWLFIHGREDEAERIVDQIEAKVRAETGHDLPEPGESITVRQRDAIPFREIATVTIKRYPRRAILGLSLFIGQAFLYNAVVFDLGTILSEFFDVSSESVPYFITLFAVGNFLGPLLLGRLFDTVGRIPMIAGTYLGSAALVALLGILLLSDSLTTWSFMALILATFFLASAGASSAYLTVSEVFPMETRALAIALFFAVGTAAGGIAGPELFGQFIHSGDTDLVALGFFIGAAAMALGGVAELFFGVRAEQQSLESIARPLTAEEADAAEVAPAERPLEPFVARNGHPARIEALHRRERAELERAEAAEHLALAYELRVRVEGRAGTAASIVIEQTLAEVATLRADSLERRAAALDERTRAERIPSQPGRSHALRRADAAERQAQELDQRAASLEARQAGARESAAAAPAAGEPDARRSAENGGRREQLARVAEQRAEAAGHRNRAEELHAARTEIEEAAPGAPERDREERIDRRVAQRRARERGGLRRLRPGPGNQFYSPGMIGTAGTASRHAAIAEYDLDREIGAIVRILGERGPASRAELAHRAGARAWGPGRFRRALREALREGRVAHGPSDGYAVPDAAGGDRAAP
jgi:MFS family permease